MKKIIHYALILDKSGSMKHIEKEVVSSFNEQVLIAIFTDGLENASSDYTASDIRKELAQAEEKGWQVKFFCRQEDNLFYKQDLAIDDSNILNITLNEDGFKAMESEICYCLNKIVNPSKI